MHQQPMGSGRTRVATAIGAMLLTVAAGSAAGAGFAIQENAASGVGNAFAGGAASAENASTVWFNPAGMSKITSPQVVVAVNLVTPSFKFHDDASQPAAFQPLGSSGGDAGSVNVVPNVYIAMPINQAWSVGLGVTAPFGLVTEWSGDWIGRYQAVKTDVQTINVNPAVSWRVSDTFAVGAGLDWQHVRAEFTSRVNYSAGIVQAAGAAAAGGLIPPSLIPTIAALTPGLDAQSSVNADDSAWGWNIGFLWDATPQTRVGAQYRSSIKYHAAGSVGFDYPALPALPPQLAPLIGQLAGGVNGVLANGGVSADIKLPSITNVSVFHHLDDRWDLMGDVQFTDWSVFKTLTFMRTTGGVLASTPENFRDTWRVSTGATYHYNDAWSFRGGIAWDESPVNATDRTPRLPDGNRTWLALGTKYQVNRNLALDAGFAYVFISRPSSNQNAGSTPAFGLIDGHYDGSATVLSGQLTYSF